MHYYRGFIYSLALRDFAMALAMMHLTLSAGLLNCLDFTMHAAAHIFWQKLALQNHTRAF